MQTLLNLAKYSMPMSASIHASYFIHISWRFSQGTISEQLAAFTANLRYEDLPLEVVERIRLHTLDIIGVCLLGVHMEFAKILRATVTYSGGTTESTLIACGGLKL